jgi:hypothetical protein
LPFLTNGSPPTGGAIFKIELIPQGEAKEATPAVTARTTTAWNG